MSLAAAAAMMICEHFMCHTLASHTQQHTRAPPKSERVAAKMFIENRLAGYARESTADPNKKSDSSDARRVCV